MDEETLEPEILDNIEPFIGEIAKMKSPVSQPISGLLTVDQARAVAEVQAAMVIARANPRDEQLAYLKIKKACQRKSLAMKAMYAYKRGGTLVEGPSIRLAEVMAIAWTNVNYGFRELSRDKNISEVESFAWDLETNTKVVRQFQVRHWRDTKKGGYEITEERDKYEYIAGMAQRRVRSCVLEIIPGDIVEAAEDQCKRTLLKGDGRTFEDQIRDMIVAFDSLGVSKEMIEDYLQHKLTGLAPQQFYNLIKIYNSIKDGIASSEEFFNIHIKPKQDEVKNQEKGGESHEAAADAIPSEPQVTSPPSSNGDQVGQDDNLTKPKSLEEAQKKLDAKREEDKKKRTKTKGKKDDEKKDDPKELYRRSWADLGPKKYAAFVQTEWRLIESKAQEWPDLYTEMITKWNQFDYGEPWPLVEQVLPPDDEENTAQDETLSDGEGNVSAELESFSPGRDETIAQGIHERREEEKQGEQIFIECPMSKNHQRKPLQRCEGNEQNPPCEFREDCDSYQKHLKESIS